VIEPERGRLLLTLLSLDATAPFLHEMGADTDDPERLRMLSRRALGQFGQDPAGAVARFRRDAPQEILAWADAFPYDADADGRALVWRQLLRRLAGISGLGYPLVDPPLTPGRLEPVRGLIERHLGDPAELAQRLRAAEAAPKSDWDARIFRSYTEGASPLDWVANAIEYWRTARAWDELSALLSMAERDALLRWGQKQGVAMEMPPPTGPPV